MSITTDEIATNRARLALIAARCDFNQKRLRRILRWAAEPLAKDAKVRRAADFTDKGTVRLGEACIDPGRVRLGDSCIG